MVEKRNSAGWEFEFEKCSFPYNFVTLHFRKENKKY